MSLFEEKLYFSVKSYCKNWNVALEFSAETLQLGLSLKLMPNFIPVLCSRVSQIKIASFYCNLSPIMFCRYRYILRTEMAPTKKGDKKKSAMNEVVTREYTINMHKRIHGM